MDTLEDAPGKETGLALNPDGCGRYARKLPTLADVLHVCRGDWHGILSATMALPGHKLLLADRTPDDTAIHDLLSGIDRLGIKAICFQGYSREADMLARALRQHLGGGMRMVAISHVTSTQFQAPFEIRMQAALRQALEAGTLNRLGSVKPGFHDVVPETWPQTLVNFCPALGPAPWPVKPSGAVLVPVENHWRKGLYTNLLAALRVPEVETIYSVNAPTHLELLEDLSRLRVTGFLDKAALYALMAQVEAVMNVSLAECQPMTQLEAFALGRPCLTGPLELQEFEAEEIIERCTVPLVDTPVEARRKLADLMAFARRDSAGLQAMIADHVARRHGLAEQRYLDFLEL